MKNIENTEQLQYLVASGAKIKYIYFWGHQQPNNTVTKACFSQWYESPFQIEDIVYPTAEHYMMVQKAELFNDSFIKEKILQSQHPAEAKKLGRSVKSFKQDIWKKNREKIVFAGNMAKFSQNPHLKDFLLGTNDRILVEASPNDRIWGIGLVADNPEIENPWKWKGLNLLGFTLMQVRNQLKTASIPT